MGHKKSDPHARLDALERWSARATLLILAGIILDIVLIFTFPHGLWEGAGAIAANALIGLGLIVEYVVIGRAIIAGGEAQRLSDERVAAADARAAGANARALEAQLALEKFRAPREFSKEQQDQLVESFRPHRGTKFDVAVPMSDAEAATLATLIESTLEQAEWQQVDWQYPVPSLLFTRKGKRDWGVTTSTNIYVDVHPESAQKLSAAAAILAIALESLGISAKPTVDPSDSSNTDAVHIRVGKKM